MRKRLSILFISHTALCFSVAFGQNFWQPTNGPYGAVVFSLAINSSGHLFAGTNGSGVFRSTDNGASWTQVNAGLMTSDVWSLAVNLSGHVFAGTWGGGIFRSINSGGAWTQVNSGLSDTDVRSLVVNNSGQIFAGTSGGKIFQSTNNGTSWTQVCSTGNIVHALMVNVNGAIFAATGGGGIFRSTDNGVTWVQVNSGIGNIDTRSLAVNASGNIFVATNAGGVYSSVDNGATWIQVGLTGRSLWSLAIAGGHVFAGTGGGGIFSSTDGGAIWTEINSGLTNGRVWCLATNPNGHVFAGTWGAGIFRSTDNGGTWTEVITGLTNISVSSIAINSTGNVFAGTSAGAFRTTDRGLTWTRVYSDFNGVDITSVATNPNGDVFLGTSGGDVFRSTDNGNSWDALLLTNSNVRNLVISSSGHIFVGTDRGGVFRSTDNGLTWPNIGLTNVDVWSLAIDSMGRIFAGTWGDGIYRSVNNGVNWTKDSITNVQVWCFTIKNDGTIFAGTQGGGIFRSTNSGQSWTELNTSLTTSIVRSLNTNAIGNVFAGTYGNGVLRSGDNGESWFSTGLFGTSIYALAVTADGYIFAGTYGGVSRTGESTIQVPTISSFSPTSGPIGTSVTITGTNFNASASNNIVYFGAVRATVTTASSTSLSVAVPVGATYTPITVTDTTTGLTAYSSKLFIVTFPGGGSITSTSFATKIDFGTGTSPIGVAVGDIDGDGKLDMVVANNQDDTVSILRNTSSSGSISYGTKTDFATGAAGLAPYGVAIGDIDGDGKLDIAVTNSNNNTISVFRNTSASGNISFATRVDYATGIYPYGIAIGDVDGDGKSDIAVTITNNLPPGSVTILRNTSTIGSISFAAKVDYGAGSNPLGAAIGDLDGDGKVDIAIVNANSNTASVLRNTSTVGSISFAPKIDFAVQGSPYQVAIGEIDGDGKLDMAVANADSNTVSILRNTSTSGSISFATRVDYGTGTMPLSVAVGDVDGDGKIDLVVGNSDLLSSANGNLSVLRNMSTSGSISFATKVDYGAGSHPRGVAIGDIDGDGKSDIAVAYNGLNTISVLRNTITASTPPTYPGEYISDANTVLLLHINETSGSIAGDASSYGNNGTATGTTIVDGRFGKTRSFTTFEAVSVNHDSSLNFGSGSFAADFWVKTTFSGLLRCMVSKYSGSIGFGIYMLSDGRVNFFLTDGTASGDLITTKTINNGQWHHIAGVRNSSTLSLHIDGIVANTISIPTVGSINTTSNVGIGSSPSNIWYSGLIDEVRISNIPRSPNEFNLQLPPVNLSLYTYSTIVNLNWQNGGGAVPLMRYKIYRGDDSTNVAIVDSSTATNYTNLGLLPATTYFYRVSAVDSTGFEGAKSYAVRVQTLGGNAPPLAPTNLTAQAGNTQVTLKWNKNTEADFLKYLIYMGTDSVTMGIKDSTFPGSINDTTKTITGLANRTRYYFRVSALDNARLESAKSLAVSATPNTEGIPTITTFSPTFGVVGTKVTITGSGFDGNNANNIVRFGAVRATIDTSTGYYIRVSVPVGSTYAPITVTVNGLVAYSASPFIVTFPNGGAITAASMKAKVDFATGASPGSVGIVDIDGDAKSDIALVNRGSGSSAISIFKNTSTSGSINQGSFGSKVDFATGNSPSSIAIMDLDGDGKPDLVVTNSGDSTVSVFRNISTSGSITAATFDANVDFPVGFSPSGVAIGDLDGDGKPDLVVGGNLVLIFRNTSTRGSISSASFAPKVDFVAGSFVRALAIGDLDGDGKPEITATSDNSTISILRNTTVIGSIDAGSFAPKVDLISGGAQIYSVAIGDLDGDGRPDLAATNWNSNTVSIFRNISSVGSITTGSFASRADFATGTYPWGIALADVDGDGRPDLVVTDYGSNTVSIFRNTSTSGSIGSGSFAASVDFTTGGQPLGVAVGDLDGDGKPDLTVTNVTSNSMSIFANNISFDGTAPGTPLDARISPSSWSNSSTFTLSWTNPSDASGIAKVWYRLNAAPTAGSPGTSVNISTASFQLNNSTLGVTTVYFYLEDGAGNKNSGSAVSVIAKFDNNKPTITHDSASVGEVTVQNGAVVGSVPSILASVFEPSNESGIKTFELEYRKSGSSSATKLSFIGSYQIPSSTYVTSGFANGVDYTLIATDSAGNVASKTYTVRVRTLTNPAPPTTFLPPAASFSGLDKVKAYRLFSVPFDLDDKKPRSLVSALGDHHGPKGTAYVNWRFESLTQEYEPMKDDTVITPGRAFFFISNDTTKHLTVGSGRAVSGRMMREQGITVTQGWNYIGNSFQFNILFDSLTVSSGSIPEYAYFTGSGPTAGGWEKNNQSYKTIFPWQGLAVRLSGAATAQLLFKVTPPPSSAPQPSKIAALDVQDILSGSDWLVRFDAFRPDNDMRAENNLVGMVRGAQAGEDPLDWFVPPFVGVHNVALYFRNPEGAMMRDIRPVNSDGEAWEMKLITGDRGAWIRLEANGADALPNPLFRAFLIDLDESMAYDLRERSSFRVNSKEGVRNFKVVVGTNEFILNHNDGVELVPTQFRLFANYPNPFNPETIIRYTIPGDVTTYRVTLKVYNVLGQEVATVVNEDQTGGYYEAKFDGRSLNSGVYFCRASVTGASGRSHTGIIKMVLVR